MEQTTRNQVSIQKQAFFRLPVPPLDEQVEIARRLDAHLGRVDSLRAALVEGEAKMAALNQSILARAFRGELVPQDPNDEPASVLLERIRAEREVAEPKKKTRGRRGRKPKPEPTPKEEPQHHAPRQPDDEPADTTDFMTFDPDTQVATIRIALLGEGPLAINEAVRCGADLLRRVHAADFKRLRSDGPLYQAIEAAIKRGVRQGCFDRPRRGRVRAIKTDAKEYERDHWLRCLLAVLDHAPIDRDDLFRTAAEWAAENMGLEFTRLRADGVIIKGLKSALNSAIRQGQVERVDGRRVRGATE